ncbi:MAG: ABC transporter ATP-binding protein [Desulfobacterales bacterium]|nr:MAG: ABC transporter ATP-binding protein [Desulfobacterales bacterium]
MIEVNRLTKNFGLKTAVDDISFTVRKGEILGFLGPNGAGKSTTMRMITGFLPPSSGTAVIGGQDIRNNPIAAREKFGYLPENAPVYPEMSVSAYLGFCADVRGYTGAERKKRVDAAIDKCFLGGVERQQIATLSKGYRQRVCFAQSILHDPEYLIMDEPTDGLDPNQKHEVRLMIRRMSEEKAIILSTHILDEVDAVCSRAIIIAGGRILADDTPADLKRRSMVYGAVSLTLPPVAAEPLVEALSALDGVGTVRVLDGLETETRIRVFPKTPDDLIADAVLSEISRQNLEIRRVFVEQGRLDEVFRTITTS